jgi:hypothetical protein
MTGISYRSVGSRASKSDNPFKAIGDFLDWPGKESGEVAE